MSEFDFLRCLISEQGRFWPIFLRFYKDKAKIWFYQTFREKFGFLNFRFVFANLNLQSLLSKFYGLDLQI